VDISDPANPAGRDTYFTGGYDENVAVAGGLAYVADAFDGLLVIDVSDPTDITKAGSYATSSWAEDVAVAGDYVYVADRDGGLLILHLAPLALQVTPTSITFLAEAGGADPPSQIISVESSGSPLTWTATISPTSGWIDVTPISGTTPSTITVSAHVSGFSTLWFGTQLVIEADAATQGSPQTIPIRLIVTEEMSNVYLPLVARNY
jgi:hypothetical protein